MFFEMVLGDNVTTVHVTKSRTQKNNFSCQQGSWDT